MKSCMKKRRIICLFLVAAMAVSVFAGTPLGSVRKVQAAAASGIKGNGTGGISININASPYTDFANINTWGQYAYGTQGCAWFASARVKQLTGKGNMIYSGTSWYNSAYSYYGFSRGTTLKAPALVCWSGHVAIVEKISGSTAYISEGGQCYYSDSSHGYTVIRTVSTSAVSSLNSGFLGYVYLPGAASGGNAPRGCVDSITCSGIGKITVGGWAFDADSYNTALNIHVYIGGPAGSANAVGYSTGYANGCRPDVNNVYGCGDYHGFNFEISTTKSGSQPVYVYAINVGGGTDNTCIGQGTVYITPDTTSPVVSDVTVTDITSTGYTVKCKATDNVGVTKVLFPTWRIKDGSEGCTWYEGTKSGDTWSFTYTGASFEDEYITHVYAYDTAGNSRAVSAGNVFCQRPEAAYEVCEGGIYEIHSAVDESKGLDVIGASEKNGANIQLYDNNHSDAQRFKLTNEGNGYYSLQAVCSGKVLDIAGGDHKSGANLQQYTSNGSAAQQFRFVSAGDGYCYIISKLGSYVNVHGGEKKNSTNIWMYSFDGTAAEKWKLVCVEDSGTAPGSASVVSEESTEPAEDDKTGSDIKPEASTKPTVNTEPETEPGMQSVLGKETVDDTGEEVAADTSESEGNTSTATVPGKVMLKKVQALKNEKMKATWKWFSGQDGFQVQYAQNRRFTKKRRSKNVGMYSSSVTLKRLGCRKVYYVRIRAYKKSGNGKTYGKWSRVIKCRVK